MTYDAIFAQKNICNKIVEKKADFVFTVKDNQKSLKNIIAAATKVAEASLSPHSQIIIDGVTCCETTDIGHGRVEVRNIIACPMPHFSG